MGRRRLGTADWVPTTQAKIPIRADLGPGALAVWGWVGGWGFLFFAVHPDRCFNAKTTYNRSQNDQNPSPMDGWEAMGGWMWLGLHDGPCEQEEEERGGGAAGRGMDGALESRGRSIEPVCKWFG